MTNLASVGIIFGKTLLGSIALGADVADAQILKRHLVCVDVAAVNADVSSKFLLAVGELAAKPGRRWLLVQFLDIHWALTPHLHHKTGVGQQDMAPPEALEKHRYSCGRVERQCKHDKQRANMLSRVACQIATPGAVDHYKCTADCSMSYTLL